MFVEMGMARGEVGVISLKRLGMESVSGIEPYRSYLITRAVPRMDHDMPGPASCLWSECGRELRDKHLALTLEPKCSMDDVSNAFETRQKYKHFRILVIGRANAGKTTLLKRVCNTTDEPCIYDEQNNNLVRFLPDRRRCPF
jgi:hypothetical protein